MTASVYAKKVSWPDRLNNRIAAPGISLLHACAKHTFLSLAVEGWLYILFIEIVSWDLLFPLTEEMWTLINTSYSTTKRSRTKL